MVSARVPLAHICAPNAAKRPINAVTGSLAESQYSPFSANRLPRWIARRLHCVGPVLSVSDSSAPSPPGSSGPALAQQIKGPTSVGPFLLAHRIHRKTETHEVAHVATRANHSQRCLEVSVRQRRVGRTQHGTGLVAITVLDQD